MGSLKQQFNLGNIIALAGLLVTAGVGNWIGYNFETFVARSAVNSERFHMAVDSIATARVDSLIRSGVGNVMLQDILNELTDGDRERVLQEIKTNNEFANKVRESLDGITPDQIGDNHRKLSEMLKKQKMQLEQCDKILKRDGRPYLYVPCEGHEALPIRFGRPFRSDGKHYRHDIYYIKKDGVDYPLNRISNVIVDG